MLTKYNFIGFEIFAELFSIKCRQLATDGLKNRLTEIL